MLTLSHTVELWDRFIRGTLIRPSCPTSIKLWAVRCRWVVFHRSGRVGGNWFSSRHVVCSFARRTSRRSGWRRWSQPGSWLSWLVLSFFIACVTQHVSTLPRYHRRWQTMTGVTFRHGGVQGVNEAEVFNVCHTFLWSQWGLGTWLNAQWPPFPLVPYHKHGHKKNVKKHKNDRIKWHLMSTHSFLGYSYECMQVCPYIDELVQEKMEVLSLRSKRRLDSLAHDWTNKESDSLKIMKLSERKALYIYKCDFELRGA